jgi:predicted metal-dependent RNase
VIRDIQHKHVGVNCTVSMSARTKYCTAGNYYRYLLKGPAYLPEPERKAWIIMTSDRVESLRKMSDILRTVLYRTKNVCFKYYIDHLTKQNRFRFFCFTN